MELVNRSERIRGRAWKEAQRGDLDRYHLLVNLGLEAHTIADLPGHGCQHV